MAPSYLNSDSSKHFEIGTKIIFISDAHLGAFKQSMELKTEQDLMALIDYAEMEGYRLCILGDLFDYWIDYRGRGLNIATNVQNRFRSFHARFGKSYFFTGNHDNWGDDSLSNLGFIPVTEYLILKVNGKHILLLHGDGLADPALGLPRPLFHRFIRNRYFVALYKRMIPAFAGVFMMKLFSKTSRFFSSTDEGEPTRLLDQWCTKILVSEHLDGVICGHHHFPRSVEMKEGFYINLGSFFKDKTVAVCNNGNFSLVKWLASARKLTPLERTTPTDER